ncbi:MAG: ABC transporter permease, partial [Acidobacteriota bacterium]
MLIRPREERDAYAGFIALRFLRARQQGFLSLISLLSALGFLLGVASLIIALALMTGFQSDVIDRIIGSNAHLLVFAEDGTVIDDPEPLIAQLGQIDGVAACEPVVHGYGGLVAAGQRVQWTSISGIDAERPAAVTRLHESMQHGSLEDLTKTTASGRPAIVLGEQLAAQLGALPGDTVRLMIPRPRLTPWGVSVRQKFL